MRALCPDCGQYHEVVRVLEMGAHDDDMSEVYEVAPVGDCLRVELTEDDLRSAQLRYGVDPLMDDDGP